MKRVRDPQTARPTILETPGDLQHRRFLTGQHHRRRPVHRRDRHPIGQQRRDLTLRRLDRHHRPTGRQRLHQPTPRRHQPTSVLQRQHTRHMRRRHLTDRMPRHKVRPHPKRLDQPEQCHLDREQGGLGPPGTVQGLRIGTPHHSPHQITKVRQYLIQRLREHREPAIQLPAHTQPLRTLPREHHSQRPVPDNTTRNLIHTIHDHTRSRQQHRPVLERGPARRQRKPDIQRPTAVRSGGEPVHLGIQSDGRPPRHHPRHHARHHRRLLDPLLRRRRLLHDHVRVGATDAERRDARPARMFRIRPGGGVPHQLDIAHRPVDVRRRSIHMQRARQHPIPHRHHRLDHTRDTRRSLRMTNIRLHRPQQQRTPRVPILPIGGQQRLRLDRVTERRPGPVRLHHIHIHRGQTATGQRLPDHPLLRGTIRRSQPIRRTILIHRAAPHHRQDRMPVPLSIGQPLQHQHADTLTPAHTISRVRERLAPPVRRQPTLPRELHKRRRRRHHRHTTGQRQRTLTRTQRLRRQMHRHQRRRTRRINRHRRTLKPKRVRHPTRRHTRRTSVAPERLELVAGEQGPVVVVHDPGEHADPAAAQRHRIDARALDRLPHRLQQQPLLRVGRQGLARAHPEEVGVELRSLVQEATGTGRRGPGALGVRVVEPVRIPASVRREFRHRVHASGHQLPQLVGGRDPARVAARHAHDHHRIVDDRHRRAHRAVCHRLRGPGGELLAQVVGKCLRRRIVEHQGCREPQFCRRTQPVAQLDGRERVEAQVAEGPHGIDRCRAFVAEYQRDLAADQLQQRRVTVRTAQSGQPVGQAATTTATVTNVDGRAGGAADRGAYQAPQHRWDLPARTQGGQVQPDREHRGPAGGQRGVEQGHALSGGQGRETRAAQAGSVDLGQTAGHPAAVGLGPRAPRQRYPG